MRAVINLCFSFDFNLITFLASAREKTRTLFISAWIMYNLWIWTHKEWRTLYFKMRPYLYSWWMSWLAQMWPATHTTPCFNPSNLSQCLYFIAAHMITWSRLPCLTSFLLGCDSCTCGLCNVEAEIIYCAAIFQMSLGDCVIIIM